jgi:hypothetical protein
MEKSPQDASEKILGIDRDTLSYTTTGTNDDPIFKKASGAALL